MLYSATNKDYIDSGEECKGVDQNQQVDTARNGYLKHYYPKQRAGGNS